MNTIKTLIVTSIITMATFTQVLAQDKAVDICTVVSDLAGTIMQNRQAGTPISKMMEVADSNHAVIALIILAYDTPRFSTREYQENAVVNFTNEVGLACYKGLT